MKKLVQLILEWNYGVRIIIQNIVKQIFTMNWKLLGTYFYNLNCG